MTSFVIMKQGEISCTGFRYHLDLLSDLIDLQIFCRYHSDIVLLLLCLLCVSPRVLGTLDVVFLCCEEHKQNLIHQYFTEVAVESSEMLLSNPQEIKIKPSQWMDITKEK